jgi:hypothetical protein
MTNAALPPIRSVNLVVAISGSINAAPPGSRRTSFLPSHAIKRSRAWGLATLLLAGTWLVAPAHGSDWPGIDPVAPTDCTLVPELVSQPPFAGTPDQLPPLASLSGLIEQRSCFSDTLRSQAWTLFAANAALAREHRLEVGGIHFFAHENNISSTPSTALTGYLRLLHSAGISRVGLHLGSFPWLCDSDSDPGCALASQAVARYDAIFQEAQTLGLNIRVLLPIAASQRLPTVGWQDYTTSVLAMLQRVLDRYPGDIDQVGLHEPSSVEKLILQAQTPGATLSPDDWRHDLVDPVCALAQARAIACSASLIPGPREHPHAEWRFLDAAILSRADRLGINNIQLYGLNTSVIEASEEMVQQFADGVLESGASGPARGRHQVFINAAWRPAWPATAGRPLESNAAGVGCAELQDADLSYLGALMAWSRALRIGGVNVFYTTGFAAQVTCDRDIRLYASVQSPLQPGVVWPNYQIGNPISDGNYRLTLIQSLMQPLPVLTPLGERFATLAGIARHGVAFFVNGFEASAP